MRIGHVYFVKYAMMRHKWVPGSNLSSISACNLILCLPMVYAFIGYVTQLQALVLY